MGKVSVMKSKKIVKKPGKKPMVVSKTKVSKWPKSKKK